MKKEELVKEIQRLETRDSVLRDNERHLRIEFTKLLSNTFPKGYSPYDTIGDKTMSWEEIFFRIGELTADANYAILIEQKRLMEREIDELKKKGEEKV